MKTILDYPRLKLFTVLIVFALLGSTVVAARSGSGPPSTSMAAYPLREPCSAERLAPQTTSCNFTLFQAQST
jgi:hypothetical protein